MALMFRFCRKLAVFLLVACVPLQNLHAVSMPVCTPEHETAASHQHVDDVDVVAHEHDSTVSDNGVGCDGCCLCHACSAPAIASVTMDVKLDAVYTLPPAIASRLSLFVPEQPQRPPRAVLV